LGGFVKPTNHMIQFMPELTPDERLMVMQENSVKVEETTYQKILTEDELAIRHEELASNYIKLSSIDDEKKSVMADFKLRITPLAEANKTLLSEIKTKQTTVDGTLYHMANYEDGFMETYDHEGMLISTRRLRPEEKQTNIFHLNKAANS